MLCVYVTARMFVEHILYCDERAIITEMFFFFFFKFFHARNNKEPLDRGGKYRATRDNNDENDIRKRIYIYTHTHTQ